jgi:hypothetical protein
MRRTKFWAAFLDYLGVANFVGPDELINQMGEEQFNKSMNDYSQTDRAKQSWQDDFGNVQPEQSTPTPETNQATNANQKSQSQDFLTDMLFGPLNPL